MATKKALNIFRAVYALTKIGMSLREIAALGLPSSHHTVKRLLEEAYELIEVQKLPILAKGEKAVRIRYCGSTKHVEDIDAMRSGNQCGGGRRVKPHVYNSDDWKDKSYGYNEGEQSE
ncbi:MAG: hypothetical protein NTX01_03100 [Candidatus Omnitrophica bacterium]|nr:hypothetical protein [Candidatus Omnitrophota bacterium]